MAGRPDFGSINSAALAALPALLERWLPGGRRSGAEYVARNPTRADRKPGSFSVNLRTGKWGDFANGAKGGDPTSLLAYLEGLSQGDAAIRLAEDLGLEPAKQGQRGRRHRRAAPARKLPVQDHDTRWRTAAARELWRQARAAAGTPVETYLLARGITIAIPPTIRHHPALLYAPAGLRFHGMVAAVQGPNRQLVAVHRTYLLQDGRKAQISTPKMSLGSYSGGAVRLAAAGPTLAIAEGVESGLAFQEATGIPTWVALCRSNLPKVAIPNTVRELVIATDGDEPGRQAARQAAERWTREGVHVRIADPGDGLDHNDLLQRGAA